MLKFSWIEEERRLFVDRDKSQRKRWKKEEVVFAF